MDPVITASLIKVGGDLLGSKTTTNSSASSVQKGTERTVTQKSLTQEGINKLIYDAMSGDAGVAALATGENLGGGYASSTKALLAQDFMVKLIGELANITAPTISDKTGTTETQQTSQQTSKKRLTVICTELNRQGYLSDYLYCDPKAVEHFEKLHTLTVSGYHLWALGVVKRMRNSPRLCKMLLPTARARYDMITTGRFNLLGATTIYIGQPICFVLGALANIGARYGYSA